jgi:uncharacterized protein (TIGR00299 family) protein
MARTLYIDAFAGASGDMILGALVDLGVPLKVIKTAVASLPITGWKLSTRREDKQGISARRVHVNVPEDGPCRGWKEISRILKAGDLAAPVLRQALAVFRRILEAEAEIHGRPFDKVHLHEAGALDALIDITGACVGLAWLDPGKIVVSPLVTGSGTVRCQHGLYPVPAPATAKLIQGVPASSGGLDGERLTPTGAAILTTIAEEWGTMPAMVVDRTGYGAGTRNFPDMPNVLRMFLGDDVKETSTAPQIAVLECTLDDLPPQVLAYAAERLLEAGALDVWTTPVVMKKGRSGHTLTVLNRPGQLETMSDILIQETGTLGIRYRYENRIELERTFTKVKTSYGTIRIKAGTYKEQPIRSWPEYEDCAKAARKHDVAVRVVQDEALTIFHAQENNRRG